MNAMASQITEVSIAYPAVCLGDDQRKHQSSVLLTFVRGIHRWPVKSLHIGPVTNAENVSIWWHNHDYSGTDK